jgi:O-antigen biosynthesis protein
MRRACPMRNRSSHNLGVNLMVNKSDDLRTIFLYNGTVFVNAAKAIGGPVELSVGSARTAFNICKSDDLPKISAFQSRALDMAALAAKAAAVNDQADIAYRMGVNELADWKLSGKDTLHLTFSPSEGQCRVALDAVIKIAEVKAGMTFKAHLASHRAGATLEIGFCQPGRDQTEKRNIPFRAGFYGGANQEGYQPVSVALPDWKGPAEIHLAVNYQSYNDDGTGAAPYLFIADPHVDDDRAPDKLAIIPYLAFGDPANTSGVWMSADVPAIPAQGNAITVHWGGKSFEFNQGEAQKLRVNDEYGHSLMIESQLATAAILYVDGRPQQKVVIQTGTTWAQLPSNILDGAIHHIALKDMSGSIPYWESLCLLPAILTPADVMQRESAAPFPTALFSQTPRRYAALRAILANAHGDTDFAQLTHAFDTLEGGHANVRLRPLSFPHVSDPDVSIIIPAHNKVEVTYLALCSLLVAHNKTSFEVIVVDDGSTDETATLEDLVSGITVIHNAVPQRFLVSCNTGAAQARGNYIVLLNNDVEVTAGWIDELVAAFDRFDNVGLAGARLLYPDGRLQEAGGIVWKTGNPWNYGSRANPNAPKFSYARQADYLSGAAVMLPKAVWDKVGGLSSYLEPMYFEDTDLAFKVRAAGYKTWFIPSSEVYHFEGMSSGTDISSGFKRYQEVNRPKFKSRWAGAFRNFGREGLNPDLEKDRGISGRVLFIDHAVPRPDQDAGSYAAMQEIRLVQSLGCKVSFLPTNMAHLGKYTQDLQKIGVEAIYAPFYLTVQDYLSQHAAEFDAFYITRYQVARDVIDLIRTLAPNAKILFNNADLHFLREIRASRAAGDPQMLEEARRTRDSELDVINRSDVILSYSDVEHAVIEAYSEGQAKVVHAPWVVDIPKDVAPFAGRHGLCFLGSYRHFPNEEAVLWFAREVLPTLTVRQPDLTLSVYGARMTDKLKAMANQHFKPVGFVENVADAFHGHRVFVAPLRSGAGIKGKVIEALARGIPCVLSPVAAEGIGLRHGQDCLIAHSASEWVEAVLRLHNDEALWQEMSDAARVYMSANYSFARGRAAMLTAFEAADLYIHRTAAQ